MSKMSHVFSIQGKEGLCTTYWLDGRIDWCRRPLNRFNLFSQWICYIHYLRHLHTIGRQTTVFASTLSNSFYLSRSTTAFHITEFVMRPCILMMLIAYTLCKLLVTNNIRTKNTAIFSSFFPVASLLQHELVSMLIRSTKLIVCTGLFT
jgi:hypothetical protein